MLRRLFNRYKNFALVTLPRFYRKVPKLVWGIAAAFGFFSLGVLFTLFMIFQEQPYNYEDLEERNKKLLELVSGYEALSDLYYYQGQNFSVITDLNMIANNPGEVADAFRSSDSYKDKILIQQGRILELRKNAGLYESKESPETQ